MACGGTDPTGKNYDPLSLLGFVLPMLTLNSVEDDPQLLILLPLLPQFEIRGMNYFT